MKRRMTSIFLVVVMIATVCAVAVPVNVSADESEEGMVAYWKFNEGSGAIASDSAGDNDGTIYGAQWVDGISGKALSFDNVDEYVDIGKRFDLQTFTIEAWIYPVETTGCSYWYGIAGHYSSHWFIGIDTNGHLVGYLNDGSWKYATSQNALPTNEWIHTAFVFDNGIGTLYINGVEDNSISGVGFVGPNDSDFWIGRYADHSPFKGLIDEVRIWNRALSAEEIEDYYDQMTTIAYWKFDEGIGDAIYDSSGNNNNGTLMPSYPSNSPQWVDGIKGKALEFDGSDDYVETTDFDISDNFTITMWINPISTSNGQSFIGKHTSAGDNIIIIGFWYDGYHAQIWSEEYAAGTPETGWQFIAMVGEKMNSTMTKVTLYRDGTQLWQHDLNSIVGDASGKPWTIGQEWDGGSTSNHFNGIVDETRIYNRVLSLEELLDYYDQMTTVAYWKFDEGTGDSARDSSGNNNNGTLMPNYPTNAPQWVDGIVGKALKFDGVDDYVEIEDNNIMFGESFTIESWIKIEGDGGDNPRIFSKILSEGATCCDDFSFILRSQTGDKIKFGFTANNPNSGSESNGLLEKNRNYHIALTYDGNSLRHYIDGEIDKEEARSLSLSNSGNIARIGKGRLNLDHYNGIIDEVRIWNRALSAEEIAEYYNDTIKLIPEREPILILDTSSANIYRFKPGEERTVPIWVTCHVSPINNVTIVILDNQSLQITVVTPTVNMQPHETIRFHLRIKATEIGCYKKAIEKDILIQAVGDENSSNVESLGIIVHKEIDEGQAVPGFDASILIVILGASVLLIKRKRLGCKKEEEVIK